MKWLTYEKQNKYAYIPFETWLGNDISQKKNFFFDNSLFVFMYFFMLQLLLRSTLPGGIRPPPLLL